jgi:hypothetical protein
LLGQLVFSGYAQQTGAPHVLSPRRSLLTTAAGMRMDVPRQDAEAVIYKELSRRMRDPGDGWRSQELPWTPSFLPFLLSTIDPFRDGPDVLLRRAKALRESKSVARYRTLRRELTSEDVASSEKARRDLTKAADKIADELRSQRQDLELTQSIATEITRKALGVGAVAAGGLVAGSIGIAAGAVLAIAGEETLKRVHSRLWGSVLDDLPFRSARKLLSRSVQAESAMKGKLGTQLKDVWETGRA